MIIPILSVKDVDASVAFYTEKLGFKTDMVLAGPDGTNAFAGIRLGDSIFMLSRDNKTNVGNGVDFMVFIPNESNIDTVYADVQTKGVAIATEIKTEYWGDRVFSVHDPDGYVITISQTIHQADMEHVAKVMSGEAER